MNDPAHTSAKFLAVYEAMFLLATPPQQSYES